MVMSTLMSTGLSALQTNRVALDVTGHNIANELTPGFSRQEATRVTSLYQNMGSGYIGTGVAVQTVARAYDAFLNKQSLQTQAIAKRDEAHSTQMLRLESVFPMGDQHMGAAAEGFMNSMIDVANSPGDPSARQIALSQLQEFGARLSNTGKVLTDMQNGINEQARNSVNEINTLAKQLAKVNERIMAASNPDHLPNDTLDQRDQLVRQINDVVQVSSLFDTRGVVTLFVGSGQSLVSAESAHTMLAMPDQYDPAKVQVAVKVGDGTQIIPSDFIGAGRLAGLLRFQDQDLATAKAQVGQVAAVFSQAVNEQQAMGLNALGQPGVALMTSPQDIGIALPNRFNTGTVAAPKVKITDAYRLQASDYQVTRLGTAPDRFEVLRLSDGSKSEQMATGVPKTLSFDGVTLDFGVSTVPVGDAFTIQAASRASSQIKTLAQNGDLLAAAAPATASMKLNNAGTGRVTSLQVQAGSVLPPNWTLTFSNAFADPLAPTPGAKGSFVSSTGAKVDWVPGQPFSIDGIKMSVGGSPAVGDAVLLQTAPAGKANNANALSFVQLREATVVGRDTAGQSGVTLSDAYARALARVGAQAAQAKTNASVSSTTAKNAETARVNFSGVNMDEEAGKLIAFQQSYQASAKVLQVAQNVMDTLLSMTGR